ncbi:sigma-70 family RNA polymerase sigma factor [Actinoplanes sp. CA-131856]
MDVLERFEANRPRLRAVAHRMLGSPAEAEDAVQEAWLRLNRTAPDTINNVDAWLTTVVGRVCLDMQRSRNTRREDTYETEPPTTTTPEQETLLADSVGLALMVVLETLSPVERLAFVLHDLFAVPFDEIAPIVGRSPEAARQLASRARRRVQSPTAPTEARPSQSSPPAPPSSTSPPASPSSTPPPARPSSTSTPARPSSTPPPARPSSTSTPARPSSTSHSVRRDLVDAFLAASRAGDFVKLLSLLDPDVRLRVDEAGRRLGAPAETEGSTLVAQFFSGRAASAVTALINGTVGIAVAPGGTTRIAVLLTFDAGHITAMEAIADPSHLATLTIEPL